MKNIAILTSSRADYGIYKPLLDELCRSDIYSLTRVVFGPHLLKSNRISLQIIKNDPYGKVDIVGAFKKTNKPVDMANQYAIVLNQFVKYWYENKFDFIIALGDRFEMSAAVQASIPFKIKVVHIHGGEISLGALDNIYRDQISLVSKIHFTSNKIASERLKALLPSPENIFNVGALSISVKNEISLNRWREICKKFSLPVQKFILITFHPETSIISENKKNVLELEQILVFLIKSGYKLLITGVNSDIEHKYYSELYQKLKSFYQSEITFIESLGRENYFGALQHCVFVMGNSSSGIIESATFNKFNLLLGNRQNGRVTSKNTVKIPFSLSEFKKQISIWEDVNFFFQGKNIYYNGDSPKHIIKHLNKIND